MQDIDQILKDIFDNTIEYNESSIENIKKSNEYNKIYDLVNLLKEDTREEVIHQYLASKPEILLNLFNSYDNRGIAFINKPSIGKNYNADFAIFRVDQGGYLLYLVEIERCIDKLFTKGRNPTTVFQKSITQVKDWQRWINRNSSTFSNDFISDVLKLPKYPNKDNNSFRLKEIKQIENLWSTFFHGDLRKTIGYYIIIGRYSKLNKEEKECFDLINGENSINITTYEQLVRSIYKPRDFYYR